MPTSKLFRSSKNKTSITEISLDLPESSSKIKQRKRTQRLAAKKNENCGIDYGSQGKQQAESTSVNTVSIQNLTFPDILDRKPLQRVCVPGKNILLKEDTSKSTPLVRTRGYDFTSSTNSHFDNWVAAVPNKFRATCSSSTPSSVRSSKSLSSPSMKSSLPKEMKKSAVDAEIPSSKEMIDSFHENSGKPRNFKGAEWKKPCKESFIAGAPRPFIGTCRYNFEQISKMSKPRQKFFLTQDPRKKHCLRNPEALRKKAYSKKKEFDALTKMVKHADNVCAGTASESSEPFICEVIDLENPMQLDFQGMDYKNTYEHDEQEIQNIRVYRRICRYMERKRVKAETMRTVEEDLQRKRIAVPGCFQVDRRVTIVESTPSEESVRCGKLFRSADKPFNQERITEEQRLRRERYENLYLQSKEKKEKEAIQQEVETKEAKEQKATRLAEKNFNEVLTTIDDAIQHSFKMDRMLRRRELQRRIFPHTLRETQKFKKKLKIENHIKRDEAKVKEEFFLQRLGQQKDYPEARLEISMDSHSHSKDTPRSEQSSDDEDDIKVGKVDDHFMLRGFHFKMSNDLRGKRHQRELTGGHHKEKGCMTRDQWLAELAPKKEIVRVDVEEGIEKDMSPDDPQLLLFRPQFGAKISKVETSAVRQYIQRRLGRHYDRVLRKNLKLVKPRLRYSIKKFNLISFLYEDHQKRAAQMTQAHVHDARDRVYTQPKTTLEYIEANERDKKAKQEEIKQQRLKLLGIPCHVVKKSRLQTLCENSESETDSDWVPDREPDVCDTMQEQEELAKAKAVQVPMRIRGNMPAPKHRETTLRRHPRHPRDYFGERVPSQLFDDAVKDTGLPHMHKLPPDLIYYENVRLKKRPYTNVFDARHHHDHWNPTQQRMVDVHYQAKVVKPELTKIKRKSDAIVMQNFQMAHPPCNDFVEMDLTMPKCDTEALIAERLNKSRRNVQEITKERTKDICHSSDFVYHSRSPNDLENMDFPGHDEYLRFLHEIRQAIYKSQEADVGREEQLVVNKAALFKELEQDLKSIESCLTSLDSSECTNLTNDSGSFLLMEGKTKIPLDYIRKSLVPFEELQRSRFQAVPIDVDAEDANPFKVLPFCGQQKAQLELTTSKDSFFTFNTRLKNGLRLRLEVPVEDVRRKLLGYGSHKYPGAVTTDIDENYVEELKKRPPVKMFNFKTGRSFIKDALRLKFESMLIQGQIVRTKIYDRLNELHWESMLKVKLLYENLFAKWEKREYEAAMSIVHQVKQYYDTTDNLRRDFRDLEREQLILNMDIVFIESHWIQRTMLQNFHYLLGDQEWRLENDWIHRIEGAEEDLLESFEVSIAKRNIVNIRERDKDDAWAIKTYYEDVYLQNLHPILIVFPDAESFLNGIENLKLMTFVLLLELHFTLSIHTELQGRLEMFEEWCLRDLREREEYVQRKCAKKYFMADRAAELKRRVITFLNEPIDASFNDETFNRDRAIVAEVWRQVVPANVRGASDQDLEPVEMVAMICDVVIELLGKFETIPVAKSRRVETQIRHRRDYELKQSKQAYQIEKRIEMEMKKVRKNLEPPYKKPPRVGKLPRIRIKKKIKPVIVPEVHISEHTKFFFRAFHDEGDVSQQTVARDSLYLADNIQEQIVPFYFDHFLKMNGYTPNYNFKTHVEVRDGKEIDRIQVKSLIPEMIEKMENWEAQRRRIMEDNITHNPKMYENVQF